MTDTYEPSDEPLTEEEIAAINAIDDSDAEQDGEEADDPEEG